MNLSKQMDLINRIETELPVESWIVDGIHIWPLIRITLGDYLSFTEIENSSGKKQGYFLQKISQLKSLTRGHANYIRAYITDFKNNAQIRQKVNAVFLGDQVSRVFINGTWYHRFCDPFISVFNKNGKECLHMEPLHIYFTPRYGPSVFIQPQLDYLTIKSLLVRPHKTPIKVDGFNEFKQILKINNINLQFFSLMHLAQYACRLRLYANFFRKIFETVNPEIGFVVSYYGLIGMAFNLACRQIGIPSVDIQHGVQGDLHRAYGRWNKLPKAGYELLPTIFWVWSEVEAKAINNWNEKVKKWHRPFIGGNPWLNLWDDNNNRISAYYSEQIEKINGFLASRIKILLTLQPGISNHGIPYRLMRVIDTSPSDWFWLIRLHPGMIQERRNVQKLMAECSHKRYNIDDATDLPLPSILKKVDVHVTFYSSTIIEANRYGIPSIVLSDKGEELYIEQFKSGWAETAYDETSLRLIIEQRCKQKRIFDNFDSKLNDTKEKIQWLMKDLNILG